MHCRTYTPQVPVLQLGDFKGVESLVLADYLEEKYPEPRLGPRRPEDRAEEANLVAEFHRRVRRRKIILAKVLSQNCSK